MAESIRWGKDTERYLERQKRQEIEAVAMAKRQAAAIESMRRKPIYRRLDDDGPDPLVETAKYAGTIVGTKIGRGLFSAAQLANSIPNMFLSTWKDQARDPNTSSVEDPFISVKRWMDRSGYLDAALQRNLDLHNGLERYKDVLFPRLRTMPEITLDPDKNLSISSIRYTEDPGALWIRHDKYKNGPDPEGMFRFYSHLPAQTPTEALERLAFTPSDPKSKTEVLGIDFSGLEPVLKNLGNTGLDLTVGAGHLPQMALGGPGTSDVADWIADKTSYAEEYWRDKLHLNDDRLVPSAADDVLDLALGAYLYKGMVPKGKFVPPSMAAKAGDAGRFSMSRNFLAKDEVPDTIFGIPIIADENSYTPEDLAFFREHPEAGGYYDMGEGTPEDGTEEGMPTQADRAGDSRWADLAADAVAGLSKASERLPEMRRRTQESLSTDVRTGLGYLGSLADYGLARTQEWFASGTTKMQELRDIGRASGGVKGKVAEGIGTFASTVGSYLQPLLGGVRQATATHLSEGGRWYAPEPNTEKMFSRDALRELSAARGRSGGQGIISSRAYPSLLSTLGNPAQFEALAPTGSMSERGGALVDVADMNINYQGGDTPYDKTMPATARVVTGLANAAGNAFAAATGSSDDPDAGKIHTRIPLSKLVREDAKGGKARSKGDR